MWLSDSHPACVPVSEVETILRADKERGLGQAEAEQRYTTFGYNELVAKEEEPVWKKYLEQFKNPLIILLLCSAAVSLFMQQYDDAASISLAITIVVTVSFIMEYRSEQTLEKLKRLVPPSCLCRRQGREEKLLARLLVPGDLVLLATGDRVPADLRLVTCTDLAVDESSLSGEVEPVLKTSDTLPRKETMATSDMVNSAFMGTMVVTGRATGLVVSTGEKTQFGQVRQGSAVQYGVVLYITVV
jgi:Ca2+-transporting ATPase